MVAALYVDVVNGAYVGLDGVDLWGFATRAGAQSDWMARSRDARSYAGPYPVVAHPPCGPWGRFRRRYKGGEGARDCGPVAVEQVRRFGGVLEHPAYSKLWDECEMPFPGDFDRFGGFTLQVEQCDFGHPARKPTWLYLSSVTTIPDFPPPGKPTACMVRLRRNPHELPEVPKRHRHITPGGLAAWMLAAARSVYQLREAVC